MLENCNFTMKYLCFCLLKNVCKKSYCWFHFVLFFFTKVRIFVKFIVLQGFKLTNEKSGILGEERFSVATAMLLHNTLFLCA